MQKFFKNMHAFNAADGAKLRYNDIFFPTIGTHLVSFIYTTIFCNDTPLS